jgi:hypothetical protein
MPLIPSLLTTGAILRLLEKPVHPTNIDLVGGPVVVGPEPGGGGTL